MGKYDTSPWPLWPDRKLVLNIGGTTTEGVVRKPGQIISTMWSVMKIHGLDLCNVTGVEFVPGEEDVGIESTLIVELDGVVDSPETRDFIFHLAKRTRQEAIAALFYEPTGKVGACVGPFAERWPFDFNKFMELSYDEQEPTQVPGPQASWQTCPATGYLKPPQASGN